MKRIYLLLTAIIATLFVACSKPSLEKVAKERIKSHMKEALSSKAKTLDIRDFETIFSDDSICVVQYNVYAENYSGESAVLNMEYYILWTTLDKPKIYECFYVLSDKKSIMDRVLDFSDGKLPEEKSKRAHSLRIFAAALDALSIHEVKDLE